MAYINTTSEFKQSVMFCVTSSSAVQICSKLDNDKILYPGSELAVMAEQLPEKTFAFITADVQVHIVVSTKDEESAKAHPNALLWCIRNAVRKWLNRPIISAPINGIMRNYARKSDCREFIVSERKNSIVEHLQFDCPDKSFYLLTVP